MRVTMFLIKQLYQIFNSLRFWIYVTKLLDHNNSKKGLKRSVAVLIKYIVYGGDWLSCNCRKFTLEFSL